MSVESRRTFSLTIHPWCMSPSRDEAVRAAEDGRSGPLPTLEECIERVTERRPVPPRGGGNVTGGLRTERVTLEVTHDLDAPLGDWIVQALDESLGYDETVCVVEEVHFDDLAQLAMERDAAIREREELRNKLNRCPECNGEGKHDSGGTDASGEWINLPCEGCGSTGTMHGYVEATDKTRARVDELESAAKLAPAANADAESNHAAPAASGAAGTGWLTRDERLAVSGSILILDQHGPTNIGRTLMDLLARSLPPGPEAK